jgi:hypothetical protein
VKFKLVPAANITITGHISVRFKEKGYKAGVRRSGMGKCGIVLYLTGSAEFGSVHFGSPRLKRPKSPKSLKYFALFPEYTKPCRAIAGKKNPGTL